MLVESGPGSRRYVWAYWLALAALVVVGFAIVLTVVLAALRSAARFEVALWTLFIVGLALRCVAGWLRSCPDARPPAGEHWTRIGLPDE
jgi:uncharacterized membrane protein YedE/YeeE